MLKLEGTGGHGHSINHDLGTIGYYLVGEMQKRSHGRVDCSLMVMIGSEEEMNLITALPLVMNGGGEVLIMTAPL